MNQKLYIRLALSNIRKNAQIYIPYLTACVFTVAMFYTIKGLEIDPGVNAMEGGSEFTTVLSFGVYIVAIFSVLILLYTNSFIMKRRKTELGLYNILGMEKKHIGMVMFWETLFIYLGTLAGGLLLALLFSRLMFLLLGKIVHAPNPIDGNLPSEAALLTAGLFAAIFAAILICNLIQIGRSSPVELMRSRQSGEKEPKTKWITAAAGVICLGTGYGMALSVENPMQSLQLFTVSVILVIIGTYCLFSAGSIALLKALKKNKSYYYRTDHFISVSSMIYRMKQNAAGLATICILSTMVLVTLSTTTAMYTDQKDILNNAFRKDYVIQANFIDDTRAENLRTQAEELAARNGLTMTDAYSFRQAMIYCIDDNGRLTTAGMNSTVDSASVLLIMIPQSDYNSLTGQNVSLETDQVLVTSVRDTEITSLDFDGTDYRIAGNADALPVIDKTIGNYYGTFYVVTADAAPILSAYNYGYGQDSAILPYFYEFDTDGTDGQQEAFTAELRSEMEDQGINGGVTSRLEAGQTFYQTYGSFFFIGIFLGTMFLAATLLIIYYKQITEGYDDRERYEIMRKVGMSTKEIRKTVNSQILMVFFLPLLAAVIHLAASTKMIRGILELLHLQNEPLFWTCTVATILVFAVVYALFYYLTSRTYARIVGGNE